MLSQTSGAARGTNRQYLQVSLRYATFDSFDAFIQSISNQPGVRDEQYLLVKNRKEKKANIRYVEKEKLIKGKISSRKL